MTSWHCIAAPTKGKTAQHSHDLYSPSYSFLFPFPFFFSFFSLSSISFLSSSFCSAFCVSHIGADNKRTEQNNTLERPIVRQARKESKSRHHWQTALATAPHPTKIVRSNILPIFLFPFSLSLTLFCPLSQHNPNWELFFFRLFFVLLPALKKQFCYLILLFLK